MYLVLLGLGVGYALLSMFLGDLFDFDLGQVPFFSPFTLGAFSTVFGGSGLFMNKETDLTAVWIFLIALIASFSVSAVLFFFVAAPLQRAQVSTARSQTDAIGHLAEVTVAIPADGLGEVVYVQGGTRLSSPASSENNESIEQGSMVEVRKVVDGTFFVARARKKEIESTILLGKGEDV